MIYAGSEKGAGIIVVRLMHGLGNQLFQYALGRRLAAERSVQVIFDASWYAPENDPRADRPFALCKFDVRGEITFDGRWKRAWLPPTFAGKLRWVVDRRLPTSWRLFIEEDLERVKCCGKAFDRRVLRARKGAYLSGYWASPRYFEGVEGQLRNELVLRERPRGRYAGYLAAIEGCDSVAIHVRRGDYLKYTEFGVLGAAYYRRAVRVIKERIERPQFFVFSDNLPEARAVLEGASDCQYVQLEQGSSPAHDLSLMASCKHFINANSTFSWWGAWLSPHGGNTVLVPDKWLLGMDLSVSDIYLPGWETVQTD
jgi:hypothetical protein